MYSGQDPDPKRKDEPGEYWKADLCAKQRGYRVGVSVRPTVHPSKRIFPSTSHGPGSEDDVMNKTSIALTP